MVDRKSKYAWLAALTGKTSAETARKLIRLLESLKDQLQTITADNGKEFAGHAEVAAALGWITASRGGAGRSGRSSSMCRRRRCSGCGGC